MITPKARWLNELGRIVSVPPFTVVQRGETGVLPEARARGVRYLVRGCSVAEDQETRSHAGRSFTSGPVSRRCVPATLARAFRDRDVAECIVQEFRSGPSGVAFVCDPGEAIVEYSAVRGGVTSGRVAPYCAILPSDLQRYRALSRDVFRIAAACGAGDIEFAGIEEPHFVQVRPVTAPLEYDRDMAALKMALQEIDEDDWQQTDFCVDLAERPECDDWYLELYLATVARVFLRRLGRRLNVTGRPFIKIGRQFFASRRFRQQIRIGPFQGFVFGCALFRTLKDVERELAAPAPADQDRIMEISILLNFYQDTLGRLGRGLGRRFFWLRERAHRTLIALSRPGTRQPDLPFHRRLAGEIRRDRRRMVWLRLDYHDSQGLVVVPGDFDSGPFEAYRRGRGAPSAGAVLVTDELYPEIADHFGRIKGVICEGGAVTSHLAILAREARVPLKIQVARALDRIRGG